MRTVCLDFDGVLHAYTSPWTRADVIPDPPVPGAQKFCRALVSSGWDVVVFSTRAAEPTGLLAMESWLDDNGFPPEVRVAPPGGKPHAQVYIDDRAYRFEGDFREAFHFISGDVRPWYKRG